MDLYDFLFGSTQNINRIEFVFIKLLFIKCYKNNAYILLYYSF